MKWFRKMTWDDARGAADMKHDAEQRFLLIVWPKGKRELGSFRSYELNVNLFGYRFHSTGMLNKWGD